MQSELSENEARFVRVLSARRSAEAYAQKLMQDQDLLLHEGCKDLARANESQQRYWTELVAKRDRQIRELGSMPRDLVTELLAMPTKPRFDDWDSHAESEVEEDEVARYEHVGERFRATEYARNYALLRNKKRDAQMELLYGKVKREYFRLMEKLDPEAWRKRSLEDVKDSRMLGLAREEEKEKLLMQEKEREIQLREQEKIQAEAVRILRERNKLDAQVEAKIQDTVEQEENRRRDRVREMRESLSLRLAGVV